MYPHVTQFETRDRLVREQLDVRAALAARLGRVRRRVRSGAPVATTRSYAH